jgi:hypothetical protein
MKKLITAATLLAGIGLSGQAMASGSSDCHFHGNAVATQATVSSCAIKYQKDLIASGKINKSWAAVKAPSSLEQITGEKGKEWKVTFKDPAAADKSKESLFMFFTEQGNFIAANHTGK